jgi:hypothetical protein
MGARVVPIELRVSGGQAGAAQVNALSSSLHQLDNASGKASTGGLRSSVNATNLMRSEIQALGSQIPIVGRFFNGLTSDALNYVKAAQQVTQQQKLQKTAFDEFVKFAERITRNSTGSAKPFGTFDPFGMGHITRDLLAHDPKGAFASYLETFQSLEDPTRKAEFALDHFGAKGTQLLPILESMTADEAALVGQTTAVGTSFTAIAGPAAIVLAVIVALAAGFGLAIKAGAELINIATTQASKFQDLSDKTNFQVETLEGLNVGAIKAGSNIEKLSAGLGIFDKNITQAYESDTKLAKQFKDFNIDVSNNEKALRQVLAALAAMPPGAKQTELAMLAFGKSGKDIVGVLKNLDGTLDEQIEKLKHMGFIMSQDDVKAAADFGDKLDLLKLKITAIAGRIGLELIPYAEKLVDKFDALANEAGPKVSQWARDTIESVKNVASAIQFALNASQFGAGGVGGAEGTTLSQALFMGRVASWLSGAGLVIEGLRQTYNLLDKIGSKLRGPQPPSVTGLSPEVEAQQRAAAQSIDEAARIARGQFTSTEQERINSALKGRLELLASIKAKTSELGDTTGMVAVKTQLLNMKLEEQPGAYKALEPIIKSRAAALDQQILAEQADYVEKQKQVKAADEAAKATENFTNQTASLQQRLDDMSVSQVKARTEVQKFNEELAGGKYKGIAQDNLNARLQVLTQLDDATKKLASQKEFDRLAESAQRASNAIADIGLDVQQLANSALTDAQRQIGATYQPLDAIADRIAHISELKIDRNKFQPIVDLFKSAPEAVDLTKAFDQFWGILDKEVQDNTAPKLISTLVSLLFQAAQASRDLAAAQTPLGQAQAEYNALIKDEQQLYDPILQQQRLQNELLRDKIDLESRDFGAVVSLAKSQRELADAQVYHSTQANAQVAEFLARTESVTDIVADAKTGLIQTTFDYLDRGLSAANRHLGRMGDLLTQIEGDFIKLAATKFFQWLFGIGSQGSGSQGGILSGIFGGGPGGTPTFAGGSGVGSQGSGSISQQLFNLVRGGGRSPQNSSGLSFLNTLSPLTQEPIAVPTALSGVTPFLPLRGGGTAVDTNLLTAMGGGAGKTGLGASLLQFAPFLGLGIGAAAGSRFGIGGQIGGGAIGLGAALGISNLFGSTALSTVAATLGISMTAVTAGLFGIGAVALVASILISRNKQRRKNETDRAALNNDTYSQVIQVLRDATAGKYDSAGAAIAAFDQIKSSYFQRIANYDSKTKRIATAVWNDTKNGFEYYRPLISEAATKAAANRELAKNMIPEFALGGTVPYRTNYFSMATGLTPIKVRPGEVMIPPGGFGMTVPGVDRGYDSVYTMARPGTKVLTRTQAARARGFANGGDVDGQTTLGGGQATVVIEELTIEVQSLVGTDDAGAIVVAGVKTNNGGKAIVQRVRIARADQEL